MAATSALVKVLERRSENSVVILWQDATRCHYGDQIWFRSRSARTGICALSGNAIRSGDAIYRPRQGAPPAGQCTGDDSGLGNRRRSPGR
ncbi:DUF3331 domain-containing protein [Paraburkholderia sediminicola]